MATLTSALVLLGQEETFVDKDLLYVSGGLLILLAVVISFIGIRKENFPSPKVMPALLVVTAGLVLLTGFGAYKTATFEQAKRNAENADAAVKAQEQNVANQQSESNAATGQAGDSQTGTGATPGSSSDSAPPPAADQSAIDNGSKVFASAGCASCHTLADAGASGVIGPSLDEAVPSMSAEELNTAIVDPEADITKGYPAGTMPPNFGTTLSATDLKDLEAYLMSVAGQS